MILLMNFKKILVVSYALIMAMQTSLFAGQLHDAVRNGNIEKVEQLLLGGYFRLAFFKKDINEKDEREQTPLHVAALHGHEKIARLLVESGANKEAKVKDEWTPLYIAVQCGHETVARLLIESGANKEAKETLAGATPLYIAALMGHEAVARLLVESGANKDAQSNNGMTPLHFAANKGHEAVARLLIESGAHKDAPNKNGWTPLHIAAQKGHEAIVHLLIESEANKDAPNKDGWTPLHIAALHGHEKVTQLLVESGANKEAKDKNGMTPLHIICVQKNYRNQCAKHACVKLLLAFGANPHLLDHRQMKPEELLAPNVYEKTRALFREHSPVGTLKTLAARACAQTRLNIKNELIPEECKEYVLTDKWMDDFFRAKFDE